MDGLKLTIHDVEVHQVSLDDEKHVERAQPIMLDQARNDARLDVAMQRSIARN